MSSNVNDGYHGEMHGFPYHGKTDKLYIHKKKQRGAIWNQLLHPKNVCSFEREETTWKVLFWVGILFAFLAIIVGLIKELDEGKADDETILKLSIAELVLAIISVVVSISKHSIKYNTVVKLQKNVKTTSKQGIETATQLSNRKKVLFATCVGLTVFILIILVGFLTLQLKDDSTDIDLLYTKYTTTLTLFFVLALDGVINDVVSDAYTIAQSDQYKLVVHQLLIELKRHLVKTNEEKRIDELERFLDTSGMFTIKDLEYFVTEKVDDNPTTTTTPTTTTMEIGEEISLDEAQEISNTEKDPLVLATYC